MRLSALAPLSLLRAVLATPTSQDSAALPIILWHGLGDNYAADGINDVVKLAQEVHPSTFVYPIRLDADPSNDRRASFFGNVTEQVEQVCADIAEHPILSKAAAIDALGFSQGGVFLRAYVQRCNKPPVRSLVTFGSPHNGISDFAGCGDGDFLCKGAMALLRTNTWSRFVQSRLVPAQYYRSSDPETGLPTEEYLEYSNLLADLNNEREHKDKGYAKNIARLEKLVMFDFAEDTTVIPKESEWFAEVNGTSGKVTPLKERDLYKDDWLGLRTLDEKGGLVFKTAPGAHMHLSEELLKETFKEYYGPATKKGSGVYEQQGGLELKK
jgi:palmitoyl-protein thioesterase